MISAPCEVNEVLAGYFSMTVTALMQKYQKEALRRSRVKPPLGLRTCSESEERLLTKMDDQKF